jgi:hypothetical protein
MALEQGLEWGLEFRDYLSGPKPSLPGYFEPLADGSRLGLLVYEPDEAKKAGKNVDFVTVDPDGWHFQVEAVPVLRPAAGFASDHSPYKDAFFDPEALKALLKARGLSTLSDTVRDRLTELDSMKQLNSAQWSAAAATLASAQAGKPASPPATAVPPPLGTDEYLRGQLTKDGWRWSVVDVINAGNLLAGPGGGSEGSAPKGSRKPPVRLALTPHPDPGLRFGTPFSQGPQIWPATGPAVAGPQPPLVLSPGGEELSDSGLGEVARLDAGIADALLNPRPPSEEPPSSGEFPAPAEIPEIGRLPDIPSLAGIERLGEGDDKTVYAIGENQLIGVLHGGKDPGIIPREVRNLDDLRARGFPVVKESEKIVKIGGAETHVTYMEERFDESCVEIIENDASRYLNEQSIPQLEAIKRMQAEQGIWIRDLQIGVFRGGRIVIYDSRGWRAGGLNSGAAMRANATLNNLLEIARRNAARQRGGASGGMASGSSGPEGGRLPARLAHNGEPSRAGPAAWNLPAVPVSLNGESSGVLPPLSHPQAGAGPISWAALPAGEGGLPRAGSLSLRPFSPRPEEYRAVRGPDGEPRLLRIGPQRPGAGKFARRPAALIAPPRFLLPWEKFTPEWLIKYARKNPSYAPSGEGVPQAMNLADLYAQLPLPGSKGTRLTGAMPNPFPLPDEWKEVMEATYWLSLNWGDEFGIAANGWETAIYSGYQTGASDETNVKGLKFAGHTHLRLELDEYWFTPSPGDSFGLRSLNYRTARPNEQLPAAGFIKWKPGSAGYTIYFGNRQYFSPGLPREYYLQPRIAPLLPSRTLLENYLPKSDLPDWLPDD